jgi:hypothetical protein
MGTLVSKDYLKKILHNYYISALLKNLFVGALASKTYLKRVGPLPRLRTPALRVKLVTSFLNRHPGLFSH